MISVIPISREYTKVMLYRSIAVIALRDYAV
jgi:hypothetical protein